uniref:Uncharacterized protein n=1 Tax=Schistocephalus solidus TaxID=70667 RepID=A0A0X3PTW4_SCHSO
MSEKPHLPRDSTMTATTKAGKEFLKHEKLGDTRLVTQMKKSKKPQMRKGLTITRTIEEAKLLLGNDSPLADANTGRTLRKRSAPAILAKPSHKKSDTPKSRSKKGKTGNGPSGDVDNTV